MYCYSCGTQLNHDARFCRACGIAQMAGVPARSQTLRSSWESITPAATEAAAQIFGLVKQRARNLKGSRSGLAMIGIGVGVFVVAQIIQMIFGSSMFSDSYYMSYDFGGIIAAILINLTFYPGWLISIGFVVLGVINMLAKKAPDKEQ